MPFGTRGKEGGVELINGFVVDTVSAPSWQIMLSKRPEERIISAKKVAVISRHVAYVDRLINRSEAHAVAQSTIQKEVGRFDGDWKCGVSSQS